MDTRFWGPSGWNLLHAIAQSYPENPSKSDKSDYQIFFSTLPFVLPCIYCRRSLTDYYKKLPIDGTNSKTGQPLDNHGNFNHWLYQIHNLVNDKLRDQGLIKTENPSFREVEGKYPEQKCQQGWDFLYAIVLNYPEIPNLISQPQYQNYYLFLNYLPKVIPKGDLETKLIGFYSQYPIHYFIDNRNLLTKWLYSLERGCSNCHSCFSKRCRQIERYRAGCRGNKTDKKPTCRRISK